MTWIDEVENRWQQKEQRDARIRSEATVLYNALWDELVSDVAAARKIPRFAGLVTNGQPLARVIQLAERRMTVALHKEQQQILVSGDVVLALDIDVCSDGVVCLKLGGKRVEYDEGSRQILVRFLYPGLKPASPDVWFL